MRQTIIASMLLLGSLPVTAISAEFVTHPAGLGAQVEAAMFGEHRNEGNADRNRYRHPVGTLEFFAIEEGMTVMELWPGGGWYTEILAPVMRERGRFIIADYDPEVPDQPQYRYNQVKAMAERQAANPEIYGQMETIRYSPPASDSLGPDASVDMILTFRSFHGLYNNGLAETVMADFYAALKPGGILGVVQHRAAPGSDPAESAKKGYLPEATMVALAEAAGFELVARSEVNANPKDTHDHPEGVWTLPPSLRLGDTDRDRYLAIGESDRMTLKFRKPGS